MSNNDVALWSLLLLALTACSYALPPPPPSPHFTPTQHGVLLSLTGRNIEIAVGGPGSFRISSSVDVSSAIVPIESPMLAPVSDYPSFSVLTPSPAQVGIKTSFGSLLYDTSDQLLLFTAGATEFPPHSLFPPSDTPLRHNDTCSNVQQGVDAVNPSRTPSCPNGIKNMTQASCCAACNSDLDCKFWVLAAHPDVTGHNCWLLSALSSVVPRPDRTMGAVTFPPGPPPFQMLTVAARTLSALYFGGGGHAGQLLTRTSGSAHVANTDRFCSPQPAHSQRHSSIFTHCIVNQCHPFLLVNRWLSRSCCQPSAERRLWLLPRLVEHFIPRRAVEHPGRPSRPLPCTRRSPSNPKSALQLSNPPSCTYSVDGSRLASALVPHLAPPHPPPLRLRFFSLSLGLDQCVLHRRCSRTVQDRTVSHRRHN